MLDFRSLRPLQAMAAALFFKHRRLMLILPRQEGKTELGIRLLHDVMCQPMPTNNLFLAKDTKSGRRATREKFVRLFDSRQFAVNTDRITKRSDKRSIINIASVDKEPDRLRGGTYNVIQWSEIAFSKLEHGETITSVFDKVVQPTTRIHDAYCLLETTTNGKNDFYNLWECAKDYGFHRFKVGLDQLVEWNLVPREEFDRIEKTTHPLVFRQEFLCEFITFIGLVYEEFREEVHVREVEPPEQWQKVVLSIDWGWSPSATCVLFGYVRDGIMYVFDEIYERKMLIEATYNRIMSALGRWNIGSFAAIADHDPKSIEELNLRGIPCGLANKVNKLGNILQIKEKLWRNEIVIDPRCQNLIRDLSSATWHPKKGDLGEFDDAQCTWGHWDASDSFRYLVRHLSDFENERPEENPFIGLDQASAHEWQSRRDLNAEYQV